VIPKSQQPKSLICKPIGSALIVISLLRVLSAVELDDQATFKANKIRDVAAKGNLAAKFELCESSIAQAAPNESLGVGRCGAQLASAIQRAVHDVASRLNCLWIRRLFSS
jgi:hypothetical protein